MRRKFILNVKAYPERFTDDLGREKAGVLCPYTVEEIIDAAGFIPYRIIPNNQTIDHADAYLPNNLCSFLRHVVDMGVKGELGEYRCIIINHSCDGARRVFDIFEHYMENLDIFFLDIPKKCDELAEEYFTYNLENLISFLENLTGMPLDEEVLSGTIEVYNINRQHLEEIYTLRARFPHLFNSRFMVELLNANGRSPKSEMNKILKAIIDEGKKPGVSTEVRSKDKRVYVSGNLIDPLPILNFIEDSGGYVVGDDFCFGGRYFPLQVHDGEQPLRSLSKRYLSKHPCGRMEGIKNRCDIIIEEIKKYKASGIIYTSLKFCDNFLVDYSSLKRKLDQEGIPSLFIESEYFPMGKGQIKTRIEGFLEIL